MRISAESQGLEEDNLQSAGGSINALNFQVNDYQVKVGLGYRTEKEYILDFDATMLLITGYDASRRMAVIKRWRELEEGKATPAYRLPQTFAEALRELADKDEQHSWITGGNSKART